MVKYKITSVLVIGDAYSLIKMVFPSYNGEQTYTSSSEITIVFNSTQTPVDLGPLVKVEEITEPSE